MRIFPLDDVLCNWFPRRESFKPELLNFEHDCVNSYLGREVYGAFPYGSVNRDDCNLASDIDYFIVITDDKHKDKIRGATRKVYERSHIDVQTRVVHIDHARAGLHRIDVSFRQHLEFTVRKYGYKGRNPLEVLSKSKMPLRKGLIDSMGNYLMKLNNGYCKALTSENDRLEFLRDIMEKPWHAMRVAIQHAYGSVVPENEDFEDTKEQLVRIYSGLTYVLPLMSDIDRISLVGKEYLALLEERQKGKLSRNTILNLYDEMFKKIEDCFPFAYHFIDRNARIICQNPQ